MRADRTRVGGSRPSGRQAEARRQRAAAADACRSAREVSSPQHLPFRLLPDPSRGHRRALSPARSSSASVVPLFPGPCACGFNSSVRFESSSARAWAGASRCSKSLPDGPTAAPMLVASVRGTGPQRGLRGRDPCSEASERAASASETRRPQLAPQPAPPDRMPIRLMGGAHHLRSHTSIAYRVWTAISLASNVTAPQLIETIQYV